MPLPPPAERDDERVTAARVDAGGLLLHIGPHKTGTTAVQSAFDSSRDLLAAHSITYGGAGAAPHAAALARLGMHRGWNDAISPASRKRWTRLCAETAAAQGTVVVSTEQLCHTPAEEIVDVCRELRHAPVHVVITLRPLVEIVPSAWQEYVKSGWTTSYATFLDEVVARPPAADGPTPTFWQRHDHGGLVCRWASALGPDNVTVVIADRTDRSLVLDTFEDLLGLDRHTLPREVGATNRSLRAGEIELVRRVNEFAQRNVPWEAFNHLVRLGGVAALVERRRPDADEAAIGLPVQVAEECASFGAAAAQTIVASGVRVVGRLSGLADVGNAPAPPSPWPSTVPAAAVTTFLDGISAATARARQRWPDRPVEDMMMAAAGFGDGVHLDIGVAAASIGSVLLVCADAVGS